MPSIAIDNSSHISQAIFNYIKIRRSTCWNVAFYPIFSIGFVYLFAFIFPSINTKFNFPSAEIDDQTIIDPPSNWQLKNFLVVNRANSTLNHQGWWNFPFSSLNYTFLQSQFIFRLQNSSLWSGKKWVFVQININEIILFQNVLGRPRTYW